MSSLAVVRVNSGRNAKASKTPTVVVQTSRSSRRRKKRRGNGGRSTGSGYRGQRNSLQSYIDCLNNPFDCPPVRIGFGTLIPTQLHTAYLRNTITTNADGSFDLTIMPNLKIMAIHNTAGQSAPPVNSVFSASNFSILKAVFSTGRILAMGVRIWANIAQTVAPGYIALGLIPEMDDSEFGAIVPPAITTGSFMNAATFAKANMAQLHYHKSSTGGETALQLLWRPQDLSCFEFKADELFDDPYHSTGGDVSGPYLLAVGQSMPPNSPVFYEVVLHLETTVGFKTVSTATDDASSTMPSVATENNIFSGEQLMAQAVKQLVPDAGVVDTAIMYGSRMLKTAMQAHHLVGRMSRALNGGPARNEWAMIE